MKGEEMLAHLSEIDPELVMESSRLTAKKKSGTLARLGGRFGVIAGAAAAILVLSVACTYGVNQLDVDVLLANKMGISTDEATKLGEGVVEIDESCTRTVYNQITGETEDITLTVKESVGDKNNAFIKVETNIKLPEGYEQNICDPKDRMEKESSGEAYSYVMFETTEFGLEKKNGVSGSGAFSGETRFDEDGYLYLLLTANADHINKKKMELVLANLNYYEVTFEDGEPVKKVTPMYNETWGLKWKYYYTAEAKKYKVDQTVNQNGVNYRITKVEVTPLEIRLFGTCDQTPQDPNQYLSINSVTIGGKEYETGDANGWIFNNKNPSTSGEFEAYCTVENLGVVLDLKNVNMVKAGGEEIELK